MFYADYPTGMNKRSKKCYVDIIIIESARNSISFLSICGAKSKYLHKCECYILIGVSNQSKAMEENSLL